jgi:hypothetical protein
MVVGWAPGLGGADKDLKCGWGGDQGLVNWGGRRSAD